MILHSCSHMQRNRQWRICAKGWLALHFVTYASHKWHYMAWPLTLAVRVQWNTTNLLITSLCMEYQLIQDRADILLIAISNCSFQDSIGTAPGVFNSSLYLRGSNCFTNNCLKCSDKKHTCTCLGGGIHISSSNLTISGVSRTWCVRSWLDTVGGVAGQDWKG